MGERMLAVQLVVQPQWAVGGIWRCVDVEKDVVPSV
jgi:hypothetical protein